MLMEQEGAMPRAVGLIEAATFDPEVVRTVGSVFDAEWKAIAPAFEGWQQPAVEAARTSLAKVAIHFARRGMIDPELLRQKLHRVMQSSHAALADRRYH